jgi:SAM-dependent methyltransferase
MERFYPQRVHVCHQCFLVQLDEYVAPSDIFTDYPYFSSYSESWVAHAKQYCDKMVRSLDLSEKSLVIEIASNDGYLLQHLVDRRIPILGVEPAKNVAAAAIDRGIPCENLFLTTATAKDLVKRREQADLVIGNNVLAHVPDINDFVKGMKMLLTPGGTITMEFPHLLNLIELNQFDTIYHEHFSYLSRYTVNQVFTAQGLTLFDVEELPTHGSSLRIYARHSDDKTRPLSAAAKQIAQRELDWGVNKLSTYSDYREKVKQSKPNVVYWRSWWNKSIAARRSSATVRQAREIRY